MTQLPTSTAKRLYSNLSSIEILNPAKFEYENALENSGFHSIKLKYTQGKTNQNIKVKTSSGLTHHIAKMSLPTSQNVPWTYWTITSQNVTNWESYSTEIKWKLATSVQKISPALSVHTTRNL